MRGAPPVRVALLVLTAVFGMAGVAVAADTGEAATAPASRLPWQSDADLLAYRLLRQGRAAEAAEIFTDPAWKGIALYRSEQWWRAAEAFVRADDALSAYNLGNSYVQLGYYALALDAYLRALSADPHLQDATHNAGLMRRLLAEQGRDEQASGSRSRQDEIDRLEQERDEPESGGGESGDAAPVPNDAERGDAPEDDPGARSAPDAPADGGPSQGDEPDSERESPGNERDEPDDSDGEAIGGDAGEADDDPASGGASESDAPSGDTADAAGVRARLEAEQADQQWLNRIRHDPARFLDKRIRLEMRRRAAAGQAAPAGGDGW